MLALSRAFPGAPIYTTLYDRGLTYPEFEQLDIRTSWLNRVPLVPRFHRLALPLLAAVVGNTKIDARNTIASSSGWAHGFNTSGSKIVYCYSPARWLYQPQAYAGSSKFAFKRLALAFLSPLLKKWDKKKASTATKYFAISTAVQTRIRETYGIEAEVLPAPHSIDTALPQEAVDLSGLNTENMAFYLCISRLLPYKNVDAVIEAMVSLDLPLVVVGAGPDERRLLALSAGRNVRMYKDISDGQLRWLYARCTAVLSASFEDFGLTPIEAAAYGKPSIVLRWGGFLDTIRDGQSGVYFDEPTSPQICDAVRRSRALTWNEETIRQQASRFTEEHFSSRLIEEIRKN